MKQLSRSDYSRVTNLAGKVPFNTMFATAVIERQAEGTVFVDNITKPTVALIVHRYGMALLCGNPENDSFNEELVLFLRDAPSSFSMPTSGPATNTDPGI
ncbi:hypothetical protein [Nocardia sp. NPDC051981]|uniref:hypothetical protein n=1 Tax=Nocardia sp. NPDC051981 TaxID=3155417 RepID=UPI003416DCF7